MDTDKIFFKEYDKSQCIYKDSGMSCAICSATCPERAKDFIEQGRKKYNYTKEIDGKKVTVVYYK